MRQTRHADLQLWQISFSFVIVALSLQNDNCFHLLQSESGPLLDQTKTIQIMSSVLLQMLLHDMMLSGVM